MDTHITSLAIHNASHPRYKYVIDVPQRVFGRRVRKFFNSRTAAAAYRSDLVRRLKAQTAVVTHEESLVIAQYRSKLTPQEMADALRVAYDAKSRTTGSVADLLAGYRSHIEAAFTRGTVGELHHRDVCRRLPKITDAIGGLSAADLTTADLQQWVDELPGSPRTKLNFLHTLRAALSHARRTGTLPVNLPDPSGPLHLPKASPPTHIVKPQQLDDLIQTAARLNDSATYWFLAFSAFAGLRTSEVQRLDWSDIRIDTEQPDRCELYVSAGKTKNAERWVPFTPPLVELVRSGWRPPASGPVLLGLSESAIQRRKNLVTAAAAGGRYPVNALRHSYGSHHLVQFNDPPRTAMSMGHASPLQTFAAYRRAVSRQQATEYWAIRLSPPPLESV